MNTTIKYSLSRTTFVGLLLAVLTVLLGQGMGIVFGLNEAAIKDRLKTSAVEVRAIVYKGDDSAMKAVQDKAWTYMQRTHLHAGAMGGTALALIILVGLLGASARTAAVISVALGAGGLGYSVYWMWAGFRAPALGGTGAAKESLAWLAMPSSGAFVMATVAVAALIIAAVRRKHSTDPISPPVRKEPEMEFAQHI